MASTSAIQSLSPDSFLKLFLTQLKHQDPTEPADPSRMMSELSQMTTVQKLQEMSQSFGMALQTERLTLARGLIGTQVIYGTENEPQSGTVQAAQISQDEVGVRINDTFVPLDQVRLIAPAPAA